MSSRILTRCSLILGLALFPVGLVFAPRPAQAADAKGAIQQTIDRLVKSVRYGKDDLAMKQLDGEAQGAILLADAWATASPEHKTRFVQRFHDLFAALAFTKIRGSFEHLGTILYEAPSVTGDRAQIVSTLVIQHPLKKQEIRVRYDLHQLAGAWKVVDVTVLGTGGASMLQDIRTEQVQPLMAKGGWDKLLGAMQTRLDQLAASKK